MIWRVPKTWEGQTAVILAGGPSLKGFDAAKQIPTGVRVITINDSWRLAPRADVFYFCDKQWWQSQQDMNRRSMDGLLSFHDSIYKRFWVCGNGMWYADHPQIHALKFTGQQGLEACPFGLRHGSNSGYATINLAYLFGAKRIILLGYDMHTLPNGRTHWHDENRPDGFASVIKDSFLPNFDSLVKPLATAGVEVINATLGSALTCWPIMSLEEALSKKPEEELCREL